MAAVSATSAYRQLLRATRIAFWGDWHTLFAARAEARRHFDANLQQGVDAPMKIQEAVDAAQLLRTNVVQGRRIESEDGDKYELRIHDEIERGDNDTIKMPKGGNVRVDKCCGSS